MSRACELNVSGVTVCKGGEFGLSEEFHFQKLKPCTTDEECVNDDPSTVLERMFSYHALQNLFKNDNK